VHFPFQRMALAPATTENAYRSDDEDVLSS
jgi:hypothetical protein